MNPLDLIGAINAGAVLITNLTALAAAAKGTLDSSDEEALRSAIQELGAANAALFAETQAMLAEAAKRA